MNRPNTRLRIVAAIGLAMLAPAAAQGHFLWLKAVREAGRPEVRAFLSETPEPDDPELLKVIAGAKITANGRPVAWTKGADAYLVDLGQSAPVSLDGACDLGLKARGGTTFLLLYTARAQFGPTPIGEASSGDDGLRLRLIEREGKPPAVLALFRGKPAAGVKAQAFTGDAPAATVTADDRGLIEVAGVAEGKTGLLAKWVEPASGSREGKAYTEIRHYATLTAAPSASATPSAAPKPAVVEPKTFAALPEAVNSFGGAVLDGWLYVYSGHIGETHKYHRATTSPHFRRMNLRDHSTWEELPPGPPLQGVTLLAHGGVLYRVGGMTAKNEPGKPDDLVSTASFARFDPASKTWTELPALPAPRSTHDAVVAGGLLYVIGGWSMPGGPASNADFCEDALVIDLADPSKGWRTLPTPPFRRRALAVAEVNGKIFAIGGLDETGAVVRAVDVYDPATRVWTRGPEMPGGKKQGFAASAFAVAGSLYVAGGDGLLCRLSASGDRWDVVGKLAVPRITHRLLPGISGDVLIVGGTAARTSLRSIESIPVAVKAP